MHNLYKPNLEQFRDYIAIPKANGYRALHTMLLARSTGREALRIELQIRSQSMHHLAEYGITAHWQKSIETGKLDRSQQRVQAWLNQLLEIHQGVGTPQEFVDTVKEDLFPGEVYVFTPKGKILELPQGSCPVDAAYMIHTDIGNTCVAAKVDRRMVPLSTTLSNGQTVEIIVSRTSTPNPDWLNFVTTAKARTNIRQYLRNMQRTEAIELGKILLQSALQSFHQTLEHIDTQTILNTSQHFNYASIDDLFEAIGLVNQMPMVIAQHVLGHFDTQRLEKTAQTQSIYIKGSENLVVLFAECCCPIPGDPIIAIMQPGQGLTVHTEQCKLLLNNAQMLEQAIPVRWEENIQHEFKTQLIVDVSNQIGILAKIATAIAEAAAGIEDITFVTKSERCIQIQFLITVRHRDHLAKILRNIRNIKNVLRVKRV